MSILCWDNMRPDCKRWKVSPYEERNCNWVAVFDFDKEKEGIVIEEHDKLSETENPSYGGYDIVGKVPEEINFRVNPTKYNTCIKSYLPNNSTSFTMNYNRKVNFNNT